MSKEKKRALKDYYPKAMSEEEIDKVLESMSRKEINELYFETHIAMEKNNEEYKDLNYIAEALDRNTDNIICGKTKDSNAKSEYKNEVDDSLAYIDELDHDAQLYRKYKAEIEKMIARDSAKVIKVKNIDYCISNVSLDQVKNLIENTEGDITIHICLTKEDLSE